MRTWIAVLTGLLCLYFAETGTLADSPAPMAPAAAASASAQKAPEGAPRAFFPEPNHTFEAVFDGTVVLHNFVLLNRGSAALEVSEVKTG